jgi:hypothetical protein
MPTLDELKKSGAIGALYVKAKQRFVANFSKRRASVGNIQVFLNQRMQAYGFGPIGLSTKQDLQMLRGMLNLFKRSGMSDKEVYSFIEDLVVYWYDLMRMDTVTLKGKSWVLNSRPSIKDICICRESLSANLEKLTSSKEIEESAFDSHFSVESETVSDFKVEPPAPKFNRFSPTQADIDAEYERMNDE